MKYVKGKFNRVSETDILADTVEIESREYEPQHRTIKTNIGNKYYSFPSIQFNKCLWEFFNKKILYSYQITAIVNNELRTFFLPHMNRGKVCLGESTGNVFYTENSLTLDEFVDLFWFTSFDFKNAGMINLPDQIATYAFFGYPSVWMDEKYNLSQGYKLL